MIDNLTYYNYENDSCLLSGKECNEQSCITCKIAKNYNNERIAENK